MAQYKGRKVLLLAADWEAYADDYDPESPEWVGTIVKYTASTQWKNNDGDICHWDCTCWLG